MLSDFLLRNLHLMAVVILLGVWPWVSAETLAHDSYVSIKQTFFHQASKICAALQQCVGSCMSRGEEKIPVLVSDR